MMNGIRRIVARVIARTVTETVEQEPMRENQTLFEGMEPRFLMSAVAPMAINMSAPTQGNMAVVASQNTVEMMQPQTDAQVEVRLINGVVEVWAGNDPYSTNPGPANLSANVWHNYNTGQAMYTISTSNGQAVTLAANNTALHVQDNTQGSTFSFSAFDTSLLQDNVNWITIENQGGKIVSQSVLSLTGYAKTAYIFAPGMYSAPQTFVVSQSADDYAGGNTLIAEGGYNGKMVTLTNHSRWADTFYGQDNTQVVITNSPGNQVNMWTNWGSSFVAIGGGSYNNVSLHGGGTTFVHNSGGGWVSIDDDGGPQVFAFNMRGSMNLTLPLNHTRVTYINAAGSGAAYMNIQGADDGGWAIRNDLLSDVLVYYNDLYTGGLGNGKG